MEKVMRVLLVDDQAQLLMWGLKSACSGHELICAETGAEALTLCSAETFGLVLMDGSLGPEEFGHSVVTQLRALGYTGRICSFSSEDELNELALGADADFALNKSSVRENPDALRHILAEV